MQVRADFHNIVGKFVSNSSTDQDKDKSFELINLYQTMYKNKDTPLNIEEISIKTELHSLMTIICLLDYFSQLLIKDTKITVKLGANLEVEINSEENLLFRITNKINEDFSQLDEKHSDKLPSSSLIFMKEIFSKKNLSFHSEMTGNASILIKIS